MRKKKNNENAIVDESFLSDDMGDFPDRFKEAGVSTKSSFAAYEEAPLSISFFDRQNLINVLSSVMGTRQDLIRTLDSVRLVDTVQTILSVIINDTFYSIDDSDVFTVEYDECAEKVSNTQEKVNGLIEDFMEKFNLKELIQSIMEDFLLYGEYPLRVVISKNNKGIIDIREDIDPITTVGVYKLNDPVFFLEKKPGSSSGYSIRSSKEIVHFNLSSTKIRVKSSDMFNNNEKILPEYIRIGKSIIYPALQKIKQLQTIEWSSIIIDLKRAVAPILVTVSVPPTSQPEDVTEIIKKYEQHLQEVYRGMPDLENPTIGDMLSSVSNFRVVPNFTDGKGSIQTLDLMAQNSDLDNRIDRLRSAIAMAIGMPPYYLVVGQESNGMASKTEMLKVHSRYARLLTSIQKAIADGITRIIMLHIVNSGVYVDPKYIQVKFKNIINIEHLDKMEYAVASSQTIRDMWDVLSNILASDEVPAKLNGEIFVKLVNTFLSAGNPIRENLLEYVNTIQPQAAEGGGAVGGGGGGGGMFSSGGGGSVGGVEGGDFVPGGEPSEAEMYSPEGGGGGEDIGSLASDAMANQEAVPPPDFGEQGAIVDEEGGATTEGGVGAEGNESNAGMEEIGGVPSEQPISQSGEEKLSDYV